MLTSSSRALVAATLCFFGLLLVLPPELVFLRKEEGKIQFKCQVSVKFTVNFHGETSSHVKLNVCLDQLLLALWN